MTTWHGENSDVIPYHCRLFHFLAFKPAECWTVGWQPSCRCIDPLSTCRVTRCAQLHPSRQAATGFVEQALQQSLKSSKVAIERLVRAVCGKMGGRTGRKLIFLRFFLWREQKNYTKRYKRFWSLSLSAPRVQRTLAYLCSWHKIWDLLSCFLVFLEKKKTQRLC